MKKTFFILSLLLAGCSGTKKLNLDKATTLPPDWQMVPVPNGLDKVGTVFAIKNNHVTYISTIDVKTQGAPAEVATKKIEKNISVGGLINFLNLKGLDSASLLAHDTSRLSANFDVSNAYYIRPNDNLLDAYNKQKQLVIDNLNFYNMQKSNVYFVSEVLKSNKVDMTLNKNINMGADMKIIVARIIRVKPDIQVVNKDSTRLVYDLKDSLFVFYKLNLIKVNTVRMKDNEVTKDIVTDASLIVPSSR